jgi:glycosyltransferase involved in cell wall biosynthesis
MRPTHGAGRVSVVIPCFNGGHTLAMTIRSALGQAGADADIAIVDDGSTDVSLAVAKSFEPAVRVFTGPNRGVSAARNRGFAETKGEWLVFLDADDLLLAGTLALRLETARTSGADVIVCDWRDFDRDGSFEEGRVRSVDFTDLANDAEIACATHFWAPPAAVMYRRALIETIGGFREDLPVIQDARLLFDAAYNGARFAHSAHLGAGYRVQPQSLSRRDPARFSRDLFTHGIQIEALWRSRGALNDRQHEVLAGLYAHAARGLLRGEYPEYFEAVKRQREHGGPMHLHPRIATPIARVFGLRRTRQLFSLLGR